MTHRFARGVAGATPQGARCVELRLKPQLKANLPRWSVPTGRTRRKAKTVPRRSRRTGLFGAWLEPRPRGLNKNIWKAASQR